MLMKLFDTSDYDRVLRRRRLVAFGLLAVGITGIVCYLLLVQGSDTLPDFTKGFYLGGASGITIGAVILLIRTQVLLADPEARKKARIKEQDEREKTIVGQAFQFAGMFTFFACAAAMFVLVAVSRAAALAVLAVVMVYSVAWLIANLYLSKKL